MPRSWGPRAELYGADDAVEDLERLRAALRIPAFHLYGVSYGTVTAHEYARAHPERVASLVLDSPFDADRLDGRFADSFAALRRVIATVCARRACRGVTGAPRRDLLGVVARAKRRALRAQLPTGTGRREPASMTTRELVLWVLRHSYEPTTLGAVPALLAAAARGDVQPLLRHRRLTTQLRTGSAGGASAAAYWAAWCTDGNTPAARRDLHRRAFAPFPPRAALAAGNATRCAGWPGAPRIPAPPPLDVPRTRLLVGELDMVTPVETAVRMRRTFGDQADLQIVRGGGHDVLAAERPCLRAIVAAFASRRARGPECGCVEVRVLPSFPTRSADLPGSTDLDRVLTAVDATLRNVEYELRDYLIFIGDGWAGLRGGWAKGLGPFANSLEFHGYRFVEDVSIDGFVKWDRTRRRLVRGQLVRSAPGCSSACGRFGASADGSAFWRFRAGAVHRGR